MEFRNLSSNLTSKLSLHRETVALVALFALALILRLHKAEVPSFSVDEMSSLLFSSEPGLAPLFWDNNPFLYHLILKLWLLIFPMTEFSTRFLSALISAAGPVLLVLAGRVAGLRKTQWMAGVLLAFSALSIRYGQEVRMYALFEAATAFHLFALLKFRKRFSESEVKFTSKESLLLLLSYFMLALSHLLAMIPIAIGIFFLFRSVPRARTHVVAVGALLALGVGAFTVFFLRPEYLAWQQLIRFYFGSNYTFASLLGSLGQSDVLVTILLIAFGVAGLFHRDENLRFWSRHFGVSILLIGALGTIASIVDSRNIFLPRYFIFLNPLLIFQASIGLSHVYELNHQKKLKWAAAALLASYAIFFVRGYEYAKPAWRGLAEVGVQHKAQLVLTSRTRAMALPYYSRAGIPVEHLRAEDDFAEVIEEKLKKYKRIWLIDDYWSKVRNVQFVVLELNRLQIPFKTYEFADQGAEPVFGFLILRPEPKTAH